MTSRIDGLTVMPADRISTDAATTEFERLLEKKGLVQLMDVFLSNETIPVTASDLEDFSELSQSTVSRRVRELRDYGIVERSEDSSPYLYRLNMDHPAAEGLLEAHHHLHEHVEELQAASDEFDPESKLFHSGSPFVELFRYPTNVKLLAAILANPDIGMRAADVARAAEVDKSTVSDNIEVLCRIRLITAEMPKWATDPRYSLNREHPAADGFLAAIDELCREVEHTPSAPLNKESKQFPDNNDEMIDEIKDKYEKLIPALPGDRSNECRSDENWVERYLVQRQAERLEGKASAPETSSEPTDLRAIGAISSEDLPDDEDLRNQLHSATQEMAATNGCAA